MEGGAAGPGPGSAAERSKPVKRYRRAELDEEEEKPALVVSEGEDDG